MCAAVFSVNEKWYAYFSIDKPIMLSWDVNGDHHLMSCVQIVLLSYYCSWTGVAYVDLSFSTSDRVI